MSGIVLLQSVVTIAWFRLLKVTRLVAMVTYVVVGFGSDFI